MPVRYIARRTYGRRRACAHLLAQLYHDLPLSLRVIYVAYPRGIVHSHCTTHGWIGRLVDVSLTFTGAPLVLTDRALAQYTRSIAQAIFTISNSTVRLSAPRVAQRLRLSRSPLPPRRPWFTPALKQPPQRATEAISTLSDLETSSYKRSSWAMSIGPAASAPAISNTNDNGDSFGKWL